MKKIKVVVVLLLFTIKLFAVGVEDLTQAQKESLLTFVQGAESVSTTNKSYTIYPVMNAYGTTQRISSLSLDDLANITMLDFTDKGLTSLPTEIGNLSNLTYLNLTGNKLTSLPTEIGNLSNLTYLYFQNNLFSKIPTSLQNLSKINSIARNVTYYSYLSKTSTETTKEFFERGGWNWLTAQEECELNNKIYENGVCITKQESCENDIFTKWEDETCIEKTCESDSYDCSSCIGDETLAYKIDESGFCEEPVCGESEKLNSETKFCIAKTCESDNYGCPTCIGEQTLTYNADESGTCQDPSCTDNQKLINGSCITKTCKTDNYNCPSCVGEQTLTYNVDESGTCQDPSCEVGKKLVNGTCIDKTCESNNYGCPSCIGEQTLTYNADESGTCQDPTCINDTKLDNISKKCISKTCKDDELNCPTCEGEQTLNYRDDKSGYCENPVCSDIQKLVDFKCIAKTCKDDNYNCPDNCIGNQTIAYNSDGSGYCKDPTCEEDEKVSDEKICITKTCKSDNYNCPNNCIGNQTLKYNEDESGFCENPTCEDKEYLSDGLCKQNSKPEAENIEIENTNNTQLSIELKGSDNDDNQILIYSIFLNPVYGEVSEIIDNTLIYIPNSEINENDSFSYIVNDGIENSNLATVTIKTPEQEEEEEANETIPLTNSTSLTTSKETLFFNNLLSESEITLEINGGIAPYSWSSLYGLFEYKNSNKSIAVYTQNTTPKQDDIITIKDSSNPPQTKTVNAKYVSELEITLDSGYIVRDEETTFNIVGGIAPFNVTILNGDADVIDINDTKIVIKASISASNIEIGFSDKTGQKVTKNITAVDKLKTSPDSAYFDNFNGNLNIQIYGGVEPYTVTTTDGEVKLIGNNKVLYKPENRLSNQQIRIKDSSNQETLLNVFVEGGLKIIPSNPSLNVGETIKLKVVNGTGNYSWSVEKGSLNSFNGNSVIYTAPQFSTEDRVTLSDNNGVESYAIINIGEVDIKTLNLVKGWNLVSLLVDKTLAYTSEGFFPSQGTEDINILGDFNMIWTFEGNKWNIYQKDEKSLFELKPQIGFWIKMNSENSITFEGENYATDLTNLKDGWNLLGTGKKLSNITESFTFNSIWIFEENKWIKNPKTIQVGQGFWVKP